ncbi:TraI/MobA(P) family conjugative relaxase [Pseudoalteromonas sp. Of11M-6]|uniref:TraI/MobA(P) family conjugative relaxase n=1 Tax=Pseudoalteromonas sp. Of11M-6 TaxID=2917754 RepID=UPI001EF44250|nr:TraI/MobA(P) family conjugative relaxase [Pseudoalteromonas sp. Of11M-6]MCG7556062.1 relaxase/mobilization nuclease domain-containing protein [Pseudoalteromonas sp. Of11M-6]
MISKKVPMMNPRKSSFKNLVGYLTDSQGKVERLGEIRITNCHSESIEWASLEIESTQHQNTRAISDKTYHLIISFRDGENPPLDVLEDVEDVMCKALGFEEHQRVSVIHRDTENLHIHIAINKIHPEKLTLHEPYRDHYIRDITCAELEDKHGLEKDNHKHTKSLGASKASDMERMSGMESMLSYIKSLSSEIESVHSWGELHKYLASHGLKIKPKANGLVFSNSDDSITVKASNVSREFSKSKLEERFGQFENSKIKQGELSEYVPRTVSKRKREQLLYEEYQREREQEGKLKLSEIDYLNTLKVKRIAELKNSAKLKRQLLKLADRGVLRSFAVKQINKKLRDDIEQLNKEHNRKLRNVYTKRKTITWKDWLVKKSKEGDLRALEALQYVRKSKRNYSKSVPCFSSGKKESQTIVPKFINAVTKGGTLVYSVAKAIIRENESGVYVQAHKDLNGVEAALRIAIKKYGNNLDINGGDGFKRQVAKVVALKSITVNFNDEIMNNLIEEIRGQSNERAGNRARANIGRTRQSTGTRDGRNKKHLNGNAARHSVRDPRVNNFRHSKLHRQITAAPTLHGLPTVSKLNVVSIGRRPEMLLSGNESVHLEERRTNTAHDVRRVVSRARRRLDPADIYISERNEKRKKLFDIPLHQRYTEDVKGTLIFSGIRNVDSESLLLIKQKGEDYIYVKPVSKKEVGRLRRLKLGSEISISNNVIYTSKGIKR